MTTRFLRLAAGLGCAALAGAAATPAGIPVDIAALNQPAVAAQQVPALARRLLASTTIVDPRTLVKLELVAGDTAAANDRLARLDALDAIGVESALANKNPFGSWQNALDSFKQRSSLSLNDAVQFVSAYAPESPAAAALISADQRRRFIITREGIHEGGATLAAVVVRSRTAPRRLPAALIFTIYAQPDDDALRAEYGAVRGYASVTAYSRGKAWGTGRIVPYEDDGRDADRVISWIARQPWSNGSVGMYSGSYNSFTQWAAAKYRNPALKTIVPYVANNPGNGLPMENNIFLLVNYPWVYYVTDNKFVDNDAYNAPALRTLNSAWFKSGKSFRAVPQIFGRDNPWLQKWLGHPSFDAYWQSMVPYQSDFARITIPVLTITGYYDDGQGSALNFFKDHYFYNKRAVEYLVIGPYDHIGSQRAHKPDPLRGYALDPIAQYSTPQLTFDWFDWILRGGKRPALLQNRVNFEVMGANLWRHAPSIAAMADRRQTYYLLPRTLSPQKPHTSSSMNQSIDFSDRKTVNGNDYYPFPIVGAQPDLSRGLAFRSAPFSKAVEIDGFFTGRLQAVINKRDFDVEAVLYQQLPDGRLMHLSYFMGRASYGDHTSSRHLLAPGKIETIAFDRTRMVSRLMQKGSRFLLVVDGVKSPFAEINYGTGRDVGREDIRDAKTPLRIQWSTQSFITVPLRDEQGG